MTGHPRPVAARPADGHVAGITYLRVDAATGP